MLIPPHDSGSKEPNNGSSFLDEKAFSTIDLKVQDLVKSKMDESPSSLFVSETALTIFLSLDPFLKAGEKSPLPFNKKSPQKQYLLNESKRPIGLSSSNPHSWIQALMQLVYHLPILKQTLVIRAPLYLEPFRKFIDQYEWDQKYFRLYSVVQEDHLIKCLAQLFPSPSFSEIVDSTFEMGLKNKKRVCDRVELFEILKKLSTECLNIKDILFERWDCEFEFSKELEWYPSELIISLSENIEKKLSLLIPRQIFQGGFNFYYDLQGLIECRRGEIRPEYIAYLKVDGKVWYQCRNEKVEILSSNHLNLPLTSAEILHYKKVFY